MLLETRLVASGLRVASWQGAGSQSVGGTSGEDRVLGRLLPDGKWQALTEEGRHQNIVASNNVKNLL